MSEHTTLYRLFDQHGRLLYVGISGNPGRRFSQHAGDKHWWGDVADVKLVHYRTRAEAEDAELYAIRSEHPAYNIVGKSIQPSATRVGVAVGHRHAFFNKAWKTQRDTLVLVPEIALEPCVDDVDGDGAEQFAYWVTKVRERYPDEYASDSIPISWFVSGESVFESAPFQPADRYGLYGETFLTHYAWPTDEYEDRLVDWYSLSVCHSRFPRFVRYLGWVPSPLQPTCPLKSIVHSKRGMLPKQRRIAA